MEDEASGGATGRAFPHCSAAESPRLLLASDWDAFPGCPAARPGAFPASEE
jgi:hypothetical protein